MLLIPLLSDHIHISVIESSPMRDVIVAKRSCDINSKSFTEAPGPASYKSVTTSTLIRNGSISAGFDEQTSLPTVIRRALRFTKFRTR